MAENSTVMVGTWGGKGGAVKNDKKIITGLTKLTNVKIRSGSVIDSIEFSYEINGITHDSGRWGGAGGQPGEEITFSTGEYLTSMEGTYGSFAGDIVVTSLTFTTNLGEEKAYGTKSGTQFSLPILSGKIVGFHARAGTYLNAIGVYVAPLSR